MKETILLIEPDRLFARTCLKALEGNGYEVNVAASAQAAISSADSNEPDLVVLEIELARHNGIEFLYEFRSYADWLNVPVIIYSHVSASHFKLMQKEMQLLGVKRYFEKSKTSLAELVTAVADELANAAVKY